MSETFKIHLQGTSDTQQWLKAEGQLRKLDNAANDFISSLKQGVGIDLGGKLVNSIAQLPQMFGNVLERGYEFNKVMATSESGIANVLGKFMKLDQQAAKQEAAKAMAAIMEVEPKAAGSLQDLLGGFMSTVGAGQAAGITVAQNVELVGKFANALAALGMDASQLTQELRAIFTGNITPDAQLAKTLEITPQAVKAAKDAGTFYEFLNKQLGSLGDTADGPSVVLSSLQSVIDKAAGSLSKGLFNELIDGAESLSVALSDPAIKAGLEEAGVGIGKLVAQGVNLSLWAVQNAPLLLQVAEGAVRVGAAIAGIKLATIIAGLALKAQRWVALTMAVSANTTALAANTTAASANAAAMPAAANAGKVAGAAMGMSWAAGFKGVMNSLMPMIVVGLTMKLMDQAGQILSQFADWEKTNTGNANNLQNRKAAPEVLRDTIEQAGTPQDVAAARRLGSIMQRDARTDGNDVLLNQINAIMGKFDELVGKQVDHKKAAADAASAEAAFNASLIAGKAAAGDSAAQIKLATDSVDALVKKLEEATKTKLDASTFESLLSSLEAIDKTTVDDATVKNVEKLIEAAGKLRDLKADAASEAQSLADDAAAKAKQQADDELEAAEKLRAKEIERLELQARVLDAAGKSGAADDARARAEALRLQEQLVQAGLAEGDAHKQALAIVQAEIAAEREKNAVKAGGSIFASNRAPLSAADTWGDGRDRSAMGKRPGFALDAFAETQKTPLRDSFKFPALDAFASSQRTPGAEPGATAANASGGGADVAGAAKQAANSAAQMASASAKKDAAVVAELMQLRTKLDLVQAQCEQLESQLSHSNRS
jgi:hypothetical protein